MNGLVLRKDAESDEKVKSTLRASFDEVLVGGLCGVGWVLGKYWEMNGRQPQERPAKCQSRLLPRDDIS